MCKPPRPENGLKFHLGIGFDEAGNLDETRGSISLGADNLDEHENTRILSERTIMAKQEKGSFKVSEYWLRREDNLVEMRTRTRASSFGPSEGIPP